MKKLYEQYEGEKNAGQNHDFIYQAQDNGLTVSITEYYASNQAIFYGICIESKEPFPEFATIVDTDYQLMLAYVEEKFQRMLEEQALFKREIDIGEM